MFRVGQIVKIDKRLNYADWYISDFLIISRIEDNTTIIFDKYPDIWEDGQVHIDHIYDATEEYRLETIKRLLNS